VIERTLFAVQQYGDACAPFDLFVVVEADIDACPVGEKEDVLVIP